MASRRVLVAVSGVQLAANLAGQVLALRRRRAFDTPIPVLRGAPEHVGRDSLWAGTALSAPVHMLVVQAWATARLAAGPDERAHAALRWLAAIMVPGFLLERLVRQRLTVGGWDRLETPVALAGLVGAIGMAVVGTRSR